MAGTTKIPPHEAQTGAKEPSNVVGFLERVLVRSKLNDDKEPRCLVGWELGHNDANIITLMEDGCVRCSSAWKYSPERRSVGNDHGLLNALGKMKKHKTHRCTIVWRANMESTPLPLFHFFTDPVFDLATPTDRAVVAMYFAIP